MLESIEGAIKKGQPRETGNTGYTKRRKPKKQKQKQKQKRNTICIGHHYAKTNTNNVNRTCTLIKTTGGKDDLNIVSIRKSL